MTCHVYIKIVDGSLAGKEIDFKLTMDQSAMIFGRNLAILSDDTVIYFTYLIDVKCLTLLIHLYQGRIGDRGFGIIKWDLVAFE